MLSDLSFFCVLARVMLLLLWNAFFLSACASNRHTVSSIVPVRVCSLQGHHKWYRAADERVAADLTAVIIWVVLEAGDV